MGSNQNPIHRDRDKRRPGGAAYEDSKQALTQNEADIERSAPLPEDQAGTLSEEQFMEEASDRLADVQNEDDDTNS